MRPLRAQLGDAKPRPLTAVEHRRARARLLEAAMRGSPPASRAPFYFAVAFVVPFAMLLVLVRPSTRPMKGAAVLVVAPPSVAAPTPPPPPPTESAVVVVAPAPGPPTHAKAPKPGPSFDRAFANFEAGRYETADSELDAFTREFPADSRAEDAAYLRAVAHVRLGDRDGAARLARAYLDRYPNGLRRPEATRIAQSP